MKKWIAIFVVVWIAMVIVPVIAQSPVPFSSWPALYDAAEHAVVKASDDRTRIYVRIGWGPCLVIFRHEFNETYTNVPVDRYINLREYASARVNPPDQEWTEEDSINCPKPPLQVEPYWRGSRPTYYRDVNEAGTHYIRGSKAPYRVMTSDPLPSCEHLGVLDSDSYKVLSPNTELHYGNGLVMLAEEILPRQVVAVCEPQDVNILDHRW